VAKKQKTEPHSESSRAVAGRQPSSSNVEGKQENANRSDMSFFGSGPSAAPPKPRAKLPDIKKRDPATTPSPNVLSITPAPSGPKPSLLSTTLRNLQQRPAASTSASNVESPVATSSYIEPSTPVIEVRKKPNRKGHIVRFPEKIAQLELVREFTQTAFELEFNQQLSHGMSAHQLDIGEGAAFRRHEDDEPDIFEWVEPEVFYEPESDTGGIPSPTPRRTPEYENQEQRERATLAVIHVGGMAIPDPSEDDVRFVSDGPGTGHWFTPVDAVDYAAPLVPASLGHNNLSQLLSSIVSSTSMGGGAHRATPPPPFPLGSFNPAEQSPIFSLAGGGHTPPPAPFQVVSSNGSRVALDSRWEPLQVPGGSQRETRRAAQTRQLNETRAPPAPEELPYKYKKLPCRFYAKGK
jgi:hypothetical protein